MKILVTGSSGLIGSAICPLLKEKEFKILKMDIRPQPKTNEKPDFQNILNKSELKKAINKIDGVVHLAAVSRVIDAEKNPALCQLVNVVGLENLISIIKNSKHHPWIIYASSREVYGEPEYLPVKEEHPLNPINVYGKCKMTAEGMLSNATKFGINSLIFRFSNVYGSVYDYETRVIPAFVCGAIRGTPLRVDSGNHVFDFTHVSDAANSIIEAVKAMDTKKFTETETFNVASGKGTSLYQLIEILQKITGKEIQTSQGQQRNFDVTKYIGDCSKLADKLGYRCQIQIEEGLNLMYKEYLNYAGG